MSETHIKEARRLIKAIEEAGDAILRAKAGQPEWDAGNEYNCRLMDLARYVTAYAGDLFPAPAPRPFAVGDRVLALIPGRVCYLQKDGTPRVVFYDGFLNVPSAQLCHVDADRQDD